MKSLFIIVEILLLYQYYLVKSDGADKVIDLSCPELQNKLTGSVLQTLSKSGKLEGVIFYLAVKNDVDGIKQSETNLSSIERGQFDLSLKTYMIIHGYRSNYKSDWILPLKDKLLETRKINLIVVDWSSGSYNLNYVASVQNTFSVAKHIFKFFEAIQSKTKSNGKKILWNRIYCIGHSLGAHVCGQAARLLRDNKFFNVERITGLDPAEPCFKNAYLDVKLDKNDAKFVDLIHTQSGGFGVSDPIGHIDFYVDGGSLQASCSGSLFTLKLQQRLCSHMAGCNYLLESIIASSDPKSCKFRGYSWNRSYESALKIIEEVKKGNSCSECPVMGIDAVNNRKNGTFLVLTTTNKPQCSKYIINSKY